MNALTSSPLTDKERADLRTVKLPGNLIIRGADLRPEFTLWVRSLVDGWTASGRISEPKAGFGFATTGPVTTRALLAADPENPRSYIASAFTDGLVPERYMWNAVRKIYELLRLTQAGHHLIGTLEAVQQYPGLLRPAVPSENEDGTVPWGPFSWGGAVIRWRRDRVILGAFSVWTQEEDDAVAAEAANWLLEGGRPLAF